ncbi:uncharacterized protein LOC121729135 isoform X2 [Aricia agestis]|nr:uncharacterized protein LOC121729135 isoform X2 [Aricia agestis]
MRGTQRVITFCLLTTVLPAILIISPLYLRNIKYADVMYKVSDSDVIQIHKGQSSIFCAKHSLKMNSTFNAFQMKGRPVLSKKRRHVTLRKSMTLPDDTLEYWGFYLFAGAVVELKACSRYEGSKIMVVTGDKVFNTCGILEGGKNKKDSLLVEKDGHVSVTLQNPKNETENFETLSDDNNDANEDIAPIPGDQRQKRGTEFLPLHNPNTILDAGVNHGGNAQNNATIEMDKSVSSFENSLHECYQDNILMNNAFPYSIQCNNTQYLETTTTLKVVHEVSTDGYYYYIFYSDNDFVNNDVHVIFDIYKPTFQYSNITDTKMCLNKTECEFDVNMFSEELVIVEVPTTDGIKNDDNNILMSVCHPRMSVYIFFPVSMILFILLFAFL